LASATHVADREHAVVPLVILTVVPAMEQPPLAAITAGLEELVVAETVKVLL
jgi:hypothetical protein